MSQQAPFCEIRASSGDEVDGSSSNHGDGSIFPVSASPELNPLSQIFSSFTYCGAEADCFQDVWGSLPDYQLDLTAQNVLDNMPARDSGCEVNEGDSAGRKRGFDETGYRRCSSEEPNEVSRESKRRLNERPKRTRSAELHNISERRRRDRIKGKMRALQELIPNCNKLDRASMLDDAINYLKALKLQVEMLSTGGGTPCQFLHMSPAGIQSMQFPQFSPFVPLRQGLGLGMGLGFGTGMLGACFSTNLHPSLLATATRLPLISGCGEFPFSHMQNPFFHSQTLPEAAASSSSLQAFLAGFSPALNCSNKGDFVCQSEATGSINYKH